MRISLIIPAALYIKHNRNFSSYLIKEKLRLKVEVNVIAGVTRNADCTACLIISFCVYISTWNYWILLEKTSCELKLISDCPFGTSVVSNRIHTPDNGINRSFRNNSVSYRCCTNEINGKDRNYGVATFIMIETVGRTFRLNNREHRVSGYKLSILLKEAFLPVASSQRDVKLFISANR